LPEGFTDTKIGVAKKLLAYRKNELKIAKNKIKYLPFLYSRWT
jgi:hypothetical protein